MAHQLPMISIPKKSTDEVDWTTPIRNLISQSYGENPDNYATECASLQRCRQDAVRGAGSDITARDLLYKYFGQLELLELRFSEIRLNFPWRDAFTNKLIVQTSIAYEKASILFQIAATHSAIAVSQSRSDPEGIKRAFYYFKSSAGMLTYINENFLHAPSTDLSRDVLKFLINIVLAQATEVFFEKTSDEKRPNALVSKIASQTASMYTTLTEDAKEFMGKGIFDRNWVTLLQIKAKYFSSLTQHYRGLADNAASKHGDALARFIQAETLAKEAHRSAQAFSASFVNNMSPNLPVDAGSSIQEKTKVHLVICTDKKNEAQRDNDLIYSAICPPFESLPVVEKTAVASTIPIQEVYGSPDVQKTIGQDIFIRLVPLSVHESASVYSEEKAKLVRAEVEKAEQSDGEARSAIDGLGVKEGLTRYKAMAEGEVAGGEEVPLEVRRWKEDITVTEERESVATLVQELKRLKTDVNRDLDTISRDLEIESKDCEMTRVKYEHLWPQAPSAILTKSQRKDLKSHISALEAAALSDQQVTALWDSVRSDISLLLSPQVEQLFLERGGLKPENLLDLDVGSEADDTAERAKIKGYVDEIEERLNRLSMISKERSEVLKDLKDKIQADDVSHLLLLNRRNTSVEPALFAAELEKFRPYQQRLASTVHHQELAFQELTTLWKGLKDLAGRGPGARKWEEREKRKKDTVKRFSRARDGYMEVRDGLAKGLQFYAELTELTSKLSASVRSYVAERTAERVALIAKLEAEKRLSVVAPPPPLASRPHVLPSPPLPSASIESHFSSLGFREQPRHHPSVSSQQTSSWSQANSPPPSSSQDHGSRFPFRANESQNNSPYASLPALPQQQQQQYAYRTSSYTPSAVSSLPPHPQKQHSQVPAFLPPPPPPPPSQLPTQSSYLVPSTPQSDPYANLAMFNPPTTSPSTQQGEYNPYYNQQQQYAQAHGGPPPQHSQYHSYQLGQQQVAFPSSPPPPPANMYGYSQEYGRHPK